jgi:hypothetical protein
MLLFVNRRGDARKHAIRCTHFIFLKISVTGTSVLWRVSCARQAVPNPPSNKRLKGGTSAPSRARELSWSRSDLNSVAASPTWVTIVQYYQWMNLQVSDATF